MVALSTAALAELWLKRASAASRSAGVAAFWPRRVRVRLRLLFASAASASADASCASSVEVSSRTITSPRRTNAPESKPSSRTVPGTSEATVTARTATSVPTASRDACHFTASTLAEVTVSGGMANDLPALIMAPICIALIPASTTMIATTPPTARNHTRFLPVRTGTAAISTRASALMGDSMPFSATWFIAYLP